MCLLSLFFFREKSSPLMVLVVKKFEGGLDSIGRLMGVFRFYRIFIAGYAILSKGEGEMWGRGSVVI